jgi:hypothetical protein
MKLTAIVSGISGLLILCTACTQSGSLFDRVSASHSHIGFVNQIEENVDFNILTYEYLYNGGGVAVGDVNNDGLSDILFSGNMVQSRLYLNQGNFVFKDATDSSSFHDRPRWKTGVVMADVNGDGLLDIYLCYSGPGTDEARSNQLFINQGVKNGMPTFAEKAAEYGLDAPGTYSTTASFFDMDNDGDLDMFLVNHADMFFNPFFNTDKLRAKRHPKFGNRLYRNDEGKFTDVSEEAHISGSGLNFGLSVSTSDINKDGWTDIYVTNDYDERDFLYLNNHDGTFTETLDKSAGHISEFSMGSDIADYNNDNNADVIVLDMLPEDNHRQKLLKGADTYDKYSTRVSHGFHHQQMRNTLQLNNGTDSAGVPLFSEVGQLAGISKTDWSWAPLFADFDNDGWKDLFITNGINKDITNLDFVKYTSGYSNNFSDKKGDKVEMWKLIQEMPSTKLNNYFYRNDHQLGFTDMSSAWGSGNKTISNGAAYADFDNDGDLDLVVNCLNDAPYILKNTSEKQKNANYLRIRLKGDGKNSLGIGSKVIVKTPTKEQYYENFITRGFQSSVDPVIHIGLGADTVVSNIEVLWPGGFKTSLSNIKANSLVTIDESTAFDVSNAITIIPDKWFADITRESGIDYVHKQSSFVDFKISPLLPYQVSKLAPALAKADVNNDGLEDLFIGSSTKQENVLYLQQANGRFVHASSQPWNTAKDKTIADAIFFDADGDGDSDLYLVSGGADYPLNASNYQDELYSNDGHGNFTKALDALPKETASGSCVRSADYNKDGLPDLFVGNKLMYGQFPEAPKSVLLINKSTKDYLQFIADNQQKDTTVFSQGMVSDATWTDLNKDGWPDLVTAGTFTPVSVFENDHGQLINKTKQYGLANTEGWWCKILADDFNGDGYTDLVIGNLGENTTFRADSTQPLTITYTDFNGDGVIDPVLCYYNQGKSYPYFSRDEIFEQMPQLQKKFGRYAAYADAQLKDMFSEEQLQKASEVKIRTLKSVCLLSDTKGHFNISSLPEYAQMSMSAGIVSKDVDGDGKLDLIIAGNCYPMRAQMGPLDAGIGLVLKGDGKGNFQPVPYETTGLFIGGDVRSVMPLQTRKGEVLVASKNGAPVQVIKIKSLSQL